MVSLGSWPSSSATVTVPAHPDFVASVRAMTRSMAVLADLALEDAEALQMAVDEAAILLLPVIDPEQQTMTAIFEVVEGAVQVVLSGASPEGSDIDRAGLPWMMLTAIDTDVDVRRDGQDLAIAVAISRRREGILP